MVADKRIGVSHIHFNPTQSEALPIRALSVFFCVAKESSSFIRVIRVSIIPVHQKVTAFLSSQFIQKNLPSKSYRLQSYAERSSANPCLIRFLLRSKRIFFFYPCYPCSYHPSSSKGHPRSHHPSPSKGHPRSHLPSSSAFYSLFMVYS